MKSIVLTLIGADRPGLVEAVARVVAEHEGSWVESRMARLAGRFAGILRATVPEGRVAALEAALARLGDDGLTVVVQPGGDDDGTRRRVALDVVGTDRPGIVQHVSRVLAAYGVNVDDLSTRCEIAPMSGEPMFRATALLQVPEGVDLEAVRSDLEALAQDLVVDVTLAPAG